MIHLDIAQGSEDWKYARLGIPTASQFDRIITKSMKASKSWDGYAQELLAEEMLDRPIDEMESQFMTRGSALENSAVRFYEFTRDTQTQNGGFVVRDDGLVGCSPDRLVGADGGLEMKTPSVAIHVGYLVGFDAEKFHAQIQGGLWLTERAWWDWMSFNPELPSAVVRYERDEEFITAAEKLVNQFVEYLAECRQKLVRGGYMSEVSIEARAFKRRQIGLPC